MDCPSCQQAGAAAVFDSVWVSSPSLQASAICVSNVHTACSLPSKPQKALDSMRYFSWGQKKNKYNFFSEAMEIMTAIS